MSKFKVGDKVRVVSKGRQPHNHFRVGDVVRILKLDDDTALCVRRDGYPSSLDQWVSLREVELVRVPEKIVVTTDGKTTTARLFSGKELAKSATAECSPRDEFDFKIGAGIAVSRLLNTEEEKPEAPQFTKADLKDGMFCRLSDGSWFVIVGDLAVCDDGEWVSMSELREDLTWEVAGNIEVVLEGVSCFNSARITLPGSRNVVWVRPGVKFE